MALSNRERVHEAIESLRVGLTPFVERMLQARLGKTWPEQLDQSRRYPLKRNPDGSLAWDSQALLKAMADHWRTVFESILGRTERALVGELSEVRNAFAHEEPFSSDDTRRPLDSLKRPLEAVSAREQADAVDKSRLELLRTVFAEQARKQTRRKMLTLEGTPRAGLQPWREVITPHPDVSSGRYQQAEFAADLAQVHRGEGSEEYRNPVEFFSRTYLTEGLENLLKTTLQRLSGRGGDPVVQTKTSFGGGKTHAMLATYHLVGAGAERPLPSVEPLMAAFGIDRVPNARRAVIAARHRRRRLRNRPAAAVSADRRTEPLRRAGCSRARLQPAVSGPPRRVSPGLPGRRLPAAPGTGRSHPLRAIDRLYQDWGGLNRFQRTRGVLRLMAAVIHPLWSQDDRGLMIVPASIPINLTAVQAELTRYLEESWDAVLARDVDGEAALPLRIDQENPNLGRYSATRRVARAIYLGSAPGYLVAHPPAAPGGDRAARQPETGARRSPD